MQRIVRVAICCAFLLVGSVQAQAPRDPGQLGPYAVAYITVSVTNPDTGSTLKTDIHYPASNGGVDPSGAPYATLVFAPGLLATPSMHPGNGRHLASWGYIVAIPDFPNENVEVRVSDIQYLFSYLETENANRDSKFFQKINTARFGLVGHSLGGLSTMIVAARDSRIKVAVGLDPAGSPFSVSDYEKEAPNVIVPFIVIGAPAHLCNVNAWYNNMYSLIGSTHKVKFVIANGSHCDFADFDNADQRRACYFLCGGAFDEERVKLAERYTTAWFNYYLRGEVQYYTYIYGREADADIQAGRVTRQVQTAPRNVTATGRPIAIELNWTLYDHPIIAGYNIYRSQQSGSYPTTPYAQVGREASYIDTNVLPGQQYFYMLRSRDAAGNEHQPSDEVSAIPGDVVTATPTPTLSVTPIPTSTVAPTSTPSPMATPGGQFRYKTYLPLISNMATRTERGTFAHKLWSLYQSLWRRAWFYCRQLYAELRTLVPDTKLLDCKIVITN